MEESLKSLDIQFDSAEESLVSKLLPEVQQVDIEFNKVSYTVRNAGSSRRILRGISGSFRSGELTAVLGPSGAGKTTLLNLLAGYSVRSEWTSGTILVNGSPRHPLRFRRMCCYIIQDALVQQYLSVLEVMLHASNLKVQGLRHEDRVRDIMSILKTLGIESCVDTRTEVLSGGQKKRLTIALELISNPSILFLDEPTTGLDTYAAKLVMQALTTLAAQGRTVVCTVHQPQPLEFQTYDNVYVVARGSCVYAGTPSHLVPFLQEAGTPCPTTYSPADYIIELTQMSSHNIDHLAAAVINEETQNKANLPSQQANSKTDEKKNYYKLKSSKSPSAWIQFFVLLRRMMLQKWRNQTALRLQLLHHVISVVLFGLSFYNIGNDASETLQSAKLCLCLCVFYTYTYVMLSILYFPVEVQLVKREHFNNWYGTLPYYVSYCISTIPTMIPNVILFTTATCYVTGQPIELIRLSYLLLIACVSAYCAEGIGLFIGSFGNIKVGCVLGPPVIGTFFALSIYGIGFGSTIEPYMNIFMKFTFLRYCLVGLWLALFGFDRAPLVCNDLYCHWKEPTLILRDMGVLEFTPWMALAGLIVYTLLYRVLGYFVFRYYLYANLPGSSASSAFFGVTEKVISHFRKETTVT